MIALDTNILVYAHRREMPWNDRAERVLRDLCEGTLSWLLPWACAHEFLAVVTNGRIFRTPTPTERAIEQLQAWVGAPTCLLISEQSDHFDNLREVLVDGKISGPKVHDARVAALCLGSGVTELWSADRDFSRFPSLRVRNPLIE